MREEPLVLLVALVQALELPCELLRAKGEVVDVQEGGGRGQELVGGAVGAHGWKVYSREIFVGFRLRSSQIIVDNWNKAEFGCGMHACELVYRKTRKLAKV